MENSVFWNLNNRNIESKGSWKGTIERESWYKIIFFFFWYPRAVVVQRILYNQPSSIRFTELRKTLFEIKAKLVHGQDFIFQLIDIMNHEWLRIYLIIDKMMYEKQQIFFLYFSRIYYYLWNQNSENYVFNYEPKLATNAMV